METLQDLQIGVPLISPPALYRLFLTKNTSSLPN